MRSRQTPAKSAAAVSNKAAPAASLSDADTDKLLAQEDIEKLLNQAGKGSPSSKSKDDSSRTIRRAKEPWPKKTSNILLNQAEKSLGIDRFHRAITICLRAFQRFSLQELSGAPASTETATLDLVRDVELNLKIELGRTHMYLEDVLKLRKGSVVPLDKLAGDPVDVYVNGRLVARGEVLVLNDNFCVRVAELITGANVFAIERC